MTNKELKKLEKSILEACQPMMEDLIAELKSTTFYDAALKADSFNQGGLAQRFREAGDAAREREQHTEFEDTLSVLSEFRVGNYDFILGVYIPTRIDVLICLKDKGQALVVRPFGDKLEEIDSIETKTDIAALYQRKPVVKNNVPLISAIVVKGAKEVDPNASEATKKAQRIQVAENRSRAQELANIINDELGTSLRWRWFFGDKRTKTGVGTSEDKYTAIGGATVEGYHIGIAKRATDQAMYSIFYVMVGNSESSFVMTVYKTLKGNFVYSNQQPGPIYKVIMKSQPNWMGDMAMPTPASSDMQNIYEFFKANRRITRMTFEFVSRTIDIRLSTDDIEDAAARDEEKREGAKWSSFNTAYGSDDRDTPKAAPAPTDDDMGAFADL